MLFLIDQTEPQGYERLRHTDERLGRHPSKRSYETRLSVLEPKYRPDDRHEAFKGRRHDR